MADEHASYVEAIRGAWRDAAADLGITVKTENRWVGDEPDRYRIIVVIESFGDRNGMAVFDRPCYDKATGQALLADGFGYTHLGSGYESYKRASFIDMLDDWGWTGQGMPPPWYSGEPVTDEG
jgi:hypothetical protein